MAVSESTGFSGTFKDETGNIYGKLIVISYAGRHGGRYASWNCCCECGREVIVLGVRLRQGQEACSTNCSRTKHGNAVKTKITAEYTAWNSMKRRCYLKTNRSYSRYGGRGIVVCDRWLESFENFLNDLGQRPSDKHSLDRIDNSGNYEPDNCRWATPTQQGNNRSSNVLVSHHGETHTKIEWTRIIGIKEETVRSRIRHGWSIHRSIFAPVKYKR